MFNVNQLKAGTHGATPDTTTLHMTISAMDTWCCIQVASNLQCL